MSTFFDPSLYSRAPSINLESGLTLARALVAASPKGMPAFVGKSVKDLKAVIAAAAKALAQRKRELGTITDVDSRALDAEADIYWKALRLRLVPWAMIAVYAKPGSRAARGAKLLRTLFGDDDVTFLNDPYHVQVTTTATLLLRIEDEKLTAELHELAGETFLALVKEIQPRYEKMVQGRLQRDVRFNDNLAEHMRALGEAIVTYATRVCATVEKKDPKTTEVARKALRPIDVHRSLAARRGGGNDGPENPTETGPTPTDAPLTAPEDVVLKDEAAAGGEPEQAVASPVAVKSPTKTKAKKPAPAKKRK